MPAVRPGRSARLKAPAWRCRRGLPGLAADPGYWRGDGLRTTRLALDTELALRGGSAAQ